MRALNTEEQDHRKRKVLHYVIQEYVRTGKPVGSQVISSSSRLGLSSATIRNILMELEKDEMITHPHTSAGRIPTDKGYRFYVDSIVELQRLAIQEQSRIQHEYQSRMREVEGLMSQTSKMLSSLSHYTGFVMTPKLDKNIFSNIELVPHSSNRILVAMITTSGLSKNFVINTKIEIPRERLRSISRIINENFQGCTLQEVKTGLIDRLYSIQDEYKEIILLAKEIGEEIEKLSFNDLYLDGASNILALPDFSRADDLHDLFKLIEEKQIFTHLIEQEIVQMDHKGNKKNKKDYVVINHSATDHKVHVKIGSENINSALQNLSVITSTYQLSDKTVGVLGILGPKRMEYHKMIALVDYVSQMVNRMLKEFGDD